MTWGRGENLTSVRGLACLIRSEGFTLRHGKTWNVYKQERCTRGNKSKETGDLHSSPAIPMQSFSNFRKLNPPRGSLFQRSCWANPRNRDWIRLPEGRPESCNFTRALAKSARSPSLKTEGCRPGCSSTDQDFCSGLPLPCVTRSSPTGKCGSSKGPGVISLLTQ